jgi:hypothetical protein
MKKELAEIALSYTRPGHYTLEEILDETSFLSHSENQDFASRLDTLATHLVDLLLVSKVMPYVLEVEYHFQVKAARLPKLMAKMQQSLTLLRPEEAKALLAQLSAKS